LNLTGEIHEANMRAWQDVPFIDGLTQGKRRKKCTKLIRDTQPERQNRPYEGDAVRVVSASKDELQAVMTTLKNADVDYPLSFTNYR